MDIWEIQDIVWVTDIVLPACSPSEPMIFCVPAAGPCYEESQDAVLNILITISYIMTERLVEIPVERKVRERIKKVKGILSYSRFLETLLDEKP
jgi:hypothetical protein